MRAQLTKLGLVACIASVTCFQSQAAADDKEASLAVQPLSGAFLRLDQKDKRAAVRYSHLAESGFLLDLSASAPIDKSSQEASLASTTGPESGLKGRVRVGYDSREEFFKFTAMQAHLAGSLAAACVVIDGLDQSLAQGEVGGSVCSKSENEILQWYEGYLAKKRPTLSFHCDLPPAAAESEGAKTTREKRIADCRRAEAVINDRAGTQRCAAGVSLCRDVEDLFAALENARADQRQEHGNQVKRNVLPRADKLYWAASGDVGYAFDLHKIHNRNDVSAKATNRPNYELEFGGRLDLYFAPAVAIAASAGVALKHEVDSVAARRCSTLASADASIRGEQCEDIKVLKDSAPSTEAAGYGRVAAMYLFRGVLEDAIPGAELRVSADGIGQKTEFTFRGTGFISPVTGPALLRFGLGLDVLLPLYTDSSKEISNGSVRDIRPFLVAGGSL